MSDDDKKAKGPSQASLLVELARSRYHMVMSEDGRPYGVRRGGPRIALPLRGRSGLRSQLAYAYTEDTNSVPSQSALADALTVLEGMAASTDPVPVHLRVAGDLDHIAIDLGTADGRCVVVTPAGWKIEQHAPVLFRRTGAMAPMPDPVRASTGLAQLHNLLNMDEDAFRQLVAWLVAAWIPHIPHPVLTLKGEQGTGKSKAAQMVINLVDPSPATKRSEPRDAKAWSIQAFNSWAICLDNVSNIPRWLSDLLCKAVTGEGHLDRALYTDDDVVVMTFLRVLALTTIDAGALAGDLADRSLILDLQLIDELQRRDEEEINTAYNAVRPGILGALLDLLVGVLQVLPTVRVQRKPRMADFARILAAVDTVMGWNTLDSYRAAAKNVAADALAGDVFGSAVANFVEMNGSWTGTAAQLLELVPPPDGYHPKWPKDATRAGGQLKRVAPLLRSVGIGYDDTTRSADRHRQRLITLTVLEIAGETASAASPVSATHADLRKRADTEPLASVRTASGQCPQDDLADTEPHPADTEPALVSARSKAPDQQKHASADTGDAADTNSQHISGHHLLCAACGDPVDPADTAAGHLTHPSCAT